MYINVALEGGTFTYKVPEALVAHIELGTRVCVPLRNRKTDGWVVETKIQCHENTPAPLASGFTTCFGIYNKPLNYTKIRDIISLAYPFPLISHSLIELGKWVSAYYHSSLGTALDLMVPKIVNSSRVQEFKCSSVQGFKCSSVKFKLPLAISDSLRQRRYKSVLLYGMNRRGIYLQTISEALNYGLGVIFLVPEIKLTPEIMALFQNRFGTRVALLHSGLKKEERWSEWMRIKEGAADIVIGTMSAVFAPVNNLGVLIVDEEQDTSYKSEKQPRYSTPVVAKKRAEIEQCLYIAGSLTPSIEAFYATERGLTSKKRSTLIRLSESKQENKLFVVDMRKETEAIFSTLLKRKLKEHIANHSKILLFLNRRGFSSFIICDDCGYIPKCPNCGISLTYYRQQLVLKCHYCNYTERAIGYCPQCKGTNLSYKGIGTARVEKIFKTMFPNVNICRLDLEEVASKYITHIFNSFKSGETQVLLGTQLIAKPVDFPEVGLVGIISADTGLNLPDFRASERVFSLLMRLVKKGAEVVMQTYNPDHSVIKHLKSSDYLGFYKFEQSARMELNYPPYSHLVKLLIEHKDEKQATERANRIAIQLEQRGINFLGPSPCSVAWKRGKFRMHLLLKVSDPQQLAAAELLSAGAIIDVDPIGLL
ncbi:MAG: primosomal protein N' [Candidatus Stahlbacteria bacterium]|nr:primosomal protein N' [Candidatus Stahlbacteria bacterium]